jgi:hypothetical protein
LLLQAEIDLIRTHLIFWEIFVNLIADFVPTLKKKISPHFSKFKFLKSKQLRTKIEENKIETKSMNNLTTMHIFLKNSKQG